MYCSESDDECSKWKWQVLQSISPPECIALQDRPNWWRTKEASFCPARAWHTCHSFQGSYSTTLIDGSTYRDRLHCRQMTFCCEALIIKETPTDHSGPTFQVQLRRSCLGIIAAQTCLTFNYVYIDTASIFLPLAHCRDKSSASES